MISDGAAVVLGVIDNVFRLQNVLRHQTRMRPTSAAFVHDFCLALWRKIIGFFANDG
jgi:hypothetical protein